VGLRAEPGMLRPERLERLGDRVIVGIGIDVCDVDRFAASIGRRPGMVQRLFTPTEAERPVASLAARFAAKEALAKALGAPSGMSWQDAEIRTDASGRPWFAITGTVAARARELGIGTIHVSLSHDAGIASAVVVCEA
jgi:holo-[acyl-carrier protein] synthase